MTRSILSLFGSVFTWLAMAAFFAAITLGGVFYMFSKDLPSHESLANYAPKTISRIFSGEGKIIDEFATERRLFQPIDYIPPLVKNAFIATEDQNFYTHGGFDIKGIASAALDALQGGRLRGASTIPQQVAKNFLLSSDRTAQRKIKELILSTRLVGALPKDKILEIYLNEIFLGQNSYGVAAAAQTYFNKPLDQLTAGEAAYLASLPKSPSNRHPVRDRDEAIKWRNHSLTRMFEDGYIDKATFEAESAAPLRTVQGGEIKPFREEMPRRDYFTDEIRRQLSKSFGQEEFFGGGLSIRATIDPAMQKQAAKSLQRALETYDRGLGLWRGTGKTLPAASLGNWREALAEVPVPRDIEGWFPAVVLSLGETDAELGIEGQDATATLPAEDVTWARKKNADGTRGPKAEKAADLVSVGDVVLVRKVTDDADGSFKRWSLRQVPEIEGGFMAMDVTTGRVIAMQGGFSYESSVFNRATQAMRQPGSSFKPFVYAAALDSGFTPATIVVDAEIEVDTPQGLWKPKNSSNKVYGPTPMRTGIEQSRNLMTVRIAQEIGMELVAGYAERFGVYNPMKPFLANALGAQETTLFQMVAAYAMFANGGERVEPTLVDRVQDRWGRTIYRHDQRACADCKSRTLPPGEAPRIKSDRERVMDAITAYQLTSMMEGVVQRGSAKGLKLPVPVAGKTGTTNDAKDVWFVGYTSNIVAGCYMGYDNPQTLGENAYGGTLCVPVFQAFMEEAVKTYGGGKFKVPPGGHFINIDRFTGARLPDDATGDNVQAEYFRDGEEPVFGLEALVVDGGFGIGENLPLFAPGENDIGGQQLTTGTGKTVVVPKKADFGTLSSGGLY